jgi:hypothetical protein
MTAPRSRVDNDAEFDPALFPLPFMSCEECGHLSGDHVAIEVPKRRLLPEEEAGYNITCRKCPQSKNVCAASFRVKFGGRP